MSGAEFKITPGHLAKQTQNSVEKHAEMPSQPNLITREESLGSRVQQNDEWQKRPRKSPLLN